MESPKADLPEDIIAANRARLAQKMKTGKPEKKLKSPKSPASPSDKKSGKKPRIWDNGGKTSDLAYLERTTDRPGENDTNFVPDMEVSNPPKVLMVAH